MLFWANRFYMSLAAILPYLATCNIQSALPKRDCRCRIFPQLVLLPLSLRNTMKECGQTVPLFTPTPSGSRMLPMQSLTKPVRFDSRVWYSTGTCQPIVQNFGRSWSRAPVHASPHAYTVIVPVWLSKPPSSSRARCQLSIGSIFIGGPFWRTLSSSDSRLFKDHSTYSGFPPTAMNRYQLSCFPKSLHG